jgi:hypothetical protein
LDLEEIAYHMQDKLEKLSLAENVDRNNDAEFDEGADEIGMTENQSDEMSLDIEDPPSLEIDSFEELMGVREESVFSTYLN